MYVVHALTFFSLLMADSVIERPDEAFHWLYQLCTFFLPFHDMQSDICLRAYQLGRYPLQLSQGQQ
jgi:hypothetical protein